MRLTSSVRVDDIGVYKRGKKSFGKFGRRFYLVEFLVIILLSSFFLNNFGSFSDIYWLIHVDRPGQRKGWEFGDIRTSFFKNNLVIDWDYYNSCPGKRKALNPGLEKPTFLSQIGPVFLCPGEKKPYYLFNINIYYPAFPLRLFRNFTKGDGTPEFAENHKEIKAVVFYQKDLDELRKIKREIERIVWDDFCKDKGKGCKTLGILFLGD